MLVSGRVTVSESTRNTFAHHHCTCQRSMYVNICQPLPFKSTPTGTGKQTIPRWFSWRLTSHPFTVYFKIKINTFNSQPNEASFEGLRRISGSMTQLTTPQEQKVAFLHLRLQLFPQIHQLWGAFLFAAVFFPSHRWCLRLGFMAHMRRHAMKTRDLGEKFLQNVGTVVCFFLVSEWLISSEL